MCKLMAFFGDPFSSSSLSSFYSQQGLQNPHASGALAIKGGKVFFLKAPLAGPFFWGRYGNKILERAEDAKAGLYHVRFATHGSPKNNNNNHPIIHDDGRKLHSALIHNGVAIPPDWIKGVGETDSEQLLLYAENEGFSSWSQFQGWAAVIMLLHRKLYVYHDTAPLFYQQSEKGFQFKQVLEPGFSILPEHIVFEVKLDTLIPVAEVKLKSFRAERKSFDGDNCSYQSFS